MKLLLSITRYIVGILFVFSGLVKANDPLGLSYKMQEFFEVWGLQGLDNYTLLLSMLMIAFEIIAGIAVIVGWQLRLFSWLLLILIIFFTFLTGYAQFSGKIRTCGCFGDCIPLTAAQSFIKDVILLLMILLLFRYRNRITTMINTRVAIILLALTTVFSFGFQWWVLKHLPLVDCLPYKKGKVVADQMKIPPGAIPDSSVISFVYNKDGKEIEFTADNFPDDFDESVYHFVKRYDKLIRKGNAEPAIKDFVLVSPSGKDTTVAIVTRPGAVQWLFIKEIMESDFESLKQDILEFRKIGDKGKIPLIVISPAAEEVRTRLAKELSDVPVLSSDVVAVKTAARYPVTLYLVKDGIIVNKWSLPDFDKAAQALTSLK